MEKVASCRVSSRTESMALALARKLGLKKSEVFKRGIEEYLEKSANSPWRLLNDGLAALIAEESERRGVNAEEIVADAITSYVKRERKREGMVELLSEMLFLKKLLVGVMRKTEKREMVDFVIEEIKKDSVEQASSRLG